MDDLEFRKRMLEIRKKEVKLVAWVLLPLVIVLGLILEAVFIKLALI